MFGRGKEDCMNFYWLHFLCIMCIRFQFFNGHLVAGETLRLMEQATQDVPEQMQKGLASFSECASKGLCPLD
jgi:hypothetical protein